MKKSLIKVLLIMLSDVVYKLNVATNGHILALKWQLIFYARMKISEIFTRFSFATSNSNSNNNSNR